MTRHCSTKWFEGHDAVFVFNEFYSAVIGYLDELSESSDGKVLGRAMFHVKAKQHLGFLVSLEVINATLILTKPDAGIKKLF